VRYEWAKDKYASLQAFNGTPGKEGDVISMTQKSVR
jgi:hypothetical protein